jgi:hypothetical protein
VHSRTGPPSEMGLVEWLDDACADYDSRTGHGVLRQPKSPCLTSAVTLANLGSRKGALSASHSGQRPGGPKAISYQPKSISHQSVITALRDELDWDLSAADGRPRHRRGAWPGSVLQAFRDNNIETFVRTSHDLKSVKDFVRIQETNMLTAKVQEECSNRQHNGLKDIVERLRQVANESEELRKITSTHQRGDA